MDTGLTNASHLVRNIAELGEGIKTWMQRDPTAHAVVTATFGTLGELREEARRISNLNQEGTRRQEIISGLSGDYTDENFTAMLDQPEFVKKLAAEMAILPKDPDREPTIISILANYPQKLKAALGNETLQRAFFAHASSLDLINIAGNYESLKIVLEHEEARAFFVSRLDVIDRPGQIQTLAQWLRHHMSNDESSEKRYSSLVSEHIPDFKN